MGAAVVQGPRGPLTMQCADALRASDGDTLDAIVAGSRDVSRVRACGVNAWEMRDYSSDHPAGDGLAATLEVRRIIAARPHIHLSSRNPNAMTGDRLKRYIEVQVPETNAWIDLGLHLARLGLVRFLAQADEYDRNLQYAQAQRAAMAAKVGMWAALGSGPSVELGVDWSGTESVTIKNTGTATLDLAGYWVCNGMTRTKPGSSDPGRGYQFAKGTNVPAGGTLKVVIDSGKDSTLTKYWDLGTTHIFDNPSGAPVWLSDGAYMGNAKGQLVRAIVYPDLSGAPNE